MVLMAVISIGIAVLIEVTDESIREENDIRKLYPDVPIKYAHLDITVTLDEKTN